MEQILSKIFGMNNETRRRTVEGIVLYIFMIFATLNIPVPGEQWQEIIIKGILLLWQEIIIKGILLLIEGFELFYEQHYKNNDHTEIAAEHTGEMRQEKAEQDPDYVGERFYTEEPVEGADPDGDFDEIVDENVPIEDDIVIEGETNE